MLGAPVTVRIDPSHTKLDRSAKLRAYEEHRREASDDAPCERPSRSFRSSAAAHRRTRSCAERLDGPWPPSWRLRIESDSGADPARSVFPESGTETNPDAPSGTYRKARPSLRLSAPTRGGSGSCWARTSSGNEPAPRWSARIFSVYDGRGSRCTVKKRTPKKRPKNGQKPMSALARRADRRAAAHGIKRVKNIEDLAFGTPEDGDELLEAIREMRRLGGEV